MTQESLQFGRLHLVSDSVRKVYRHLNDAVDSAGIITAAGACGIDRSDLRRALDHNGRYVAVDHAIAIATLTSGFNFDLATRINAEIVAPSGLEVRVPVPMTDRERADRLEEYVRRMPLGERLVADALGGVR